MAILCSNSKPARRCWMLLINRTRRRGNRIMYDELESSHKKGYDELESTHKKGAPEGFLDACDAGRGSPSGPFYPPGKEAQPHIPEPEVVPIPHAVLVPKLERPLLPDIQRRVELQHRLSFYFIGRNEPRNLLLFLGILEKQFLFEKRVEAALVGDGGGRARSENTLNMYLGQVERDGTQQSVPYLRVLRAARYWV
ncbi:hypothetical protein KY285_007835 [Solanum tuberosum]|nr:hypothetical protein KY285_007835 [Solanum tuberosum]